MSHGQFLELPAYIYRASLPRFPGQDNVTYVANYVCISIACEFTTRDGRKKKKENREIEGK
ncbi:hypothetical protein WN51_00009 [Melipona quadrifasciata]|uniref:Uncharacterized protein n=1 Tax=Melipona quadrifasciata TaxID=166423 RepID=A0A0N0BBJ9_9HYME|nr:hypothetical protein WN51_00009 [Melipona quadrifasciata]